MAVWQQRISMVLYFFSLSINSFGTVWLVYYHWNVWMKGKFFLSSFSGIIVAEYVTVSLALWIAGRYLYKTKILDRLVYGLTAIPFLMLIFIPAKFYID
ncbi:hypothetical protein [Undibacterium umbellatum]|uniref:Uncharacterized protein n=1 Tax=Undibacterium umbellatum TaxID=2762300 RepID=A0ABR6Z8F6_9BURK|nr:hypothetical protein [Undibacterium umbellatum]MBC3908053.1 hypothetical protein [Undibacterium umbellatum]